LFAGLVAAGLAWGYFHTFRETGLALVSVAIIAPEAIAACRLRSRMQRFATSPEALTEAAAEFRKLVAAGERKKAVTLYREAFGLSSFEAIRAIKILGADQMRS
jgi:hypothetical protein